MKLSEAIRLGAMMGKQLFGNHLNHSGSSCAMGAAALAIGREQGFIWVDVWKWMTRTVPCPQCGAIDEVFSIIPNHLNDFHKWTRERIADWVATIEPAEVEGSRDEREGLEGQGPIGPPPEVETAETKTILI